MCRKSKATFTFFRCFRLVTAIAPKENHIFFTTDSFAQRIVDLVTVVRRSRVVSVVPRAEQTLAQNTEQAFYVACSLIGQYTLSSLTNALENIVLSGLQLQIFRRFGNDHRECLVWKIAPF